MSEQINNSHVNNLWLSVVSERIDFGAGVWVGAQVDPLVVFVFVVSELVWG